MIFIDASEGLSGDMLLAGLMGLLSKDRSRSLAAGIERACGPFGISFALLELEDRGDHGLGVAYTGTSGLPRQISGERASDLMRLFSDQMGTGHETARRILDRILEAEARAHRVDKAEVHLHEIGRPQAIANIAGIGAAAETLVQDGAGEFVCSTIVTGRGTVVVSHGAVRIPAPASQHLLEGMRHEQGEAQGERATPTGIAAAKAISSRQDDLPPSDFAARSVGFGTKRFGGRLGRVVLYRA